MRIQRAHLGKDGIQLGALFTGIFPLEQQRDDARMELAEARNRITTLTEQRDQEHSARLAAEREAKASEQARIDADRAQAVALAKLEAAQQQADDRAQVLQHEQQARKADAEGHKQSLAEERAEWKERLASIEHQAQEAREKAQEAEKERTKEQTRAEVLTARLEAFEARDAQTAKKRNADDQPTLPSGDEEST